MKLTRVQFVHTVSFGGMLQSAGNNPVGNRPGEGNTEIELDEKMRFVALTKVVNGKDKTILVPMSNVASFEAAEVVEAPKPVVKK